MTTIDFGADPGTPVDQLPSSARGLAIFDVWRGRLLKFADSDVGDTPQPVQVLKSAGEPVVTEEVQASRTAFQDHRKMMLLTQAYTYTGEAQYLAKVREFMLAWAAVNQPTGHPINQTHFNQFHISYQAIKSELSSDDRNAIEAWISLIVASCLAWPFAAEPGGATLTYGNHYTHHLAQLLHCYLSLGDSAGEAATLAQVDAHLANSFPFGNGSITYPADPADFDHDLHDMPRAATELGESIDFIRRDAFYYQHYNLEPWFEIAIQTGARYQTVLEAGFQFLRKAFTTYPKRYEFVNSVDDFDILRWEGSRSEYLQTTSMYKPDRACRAIWLYHAWRASMDPAFLGDALSLAIAVRADELSRSWHYAFRYLLKLP